MVRVLSAPLGGDLNAHVWGPGEPETQTKVAVRSSTRVDRATPWKSKGKATGLSIVPGLGQFYVGEHWSGIARLGVALRRCR